MSIIECLLSRKQDMNRVKAQALWFAVEMLLYSMVFLRVACHSYFNTNVRRTRERKIQALSS